MSLYIFTARTTESSWILTIVYERLWSQALLNTNEYNSRETATQCQSSIWQHIIGNSLNHKPVLSLNGTKYKRKTHRIPNRLIYYSIQHYTRTAMDIISNNIFRPDYMGSGRSSRASIYDTEALAECDPGKRTPDYNGRGDGHPYPTELDSGVGTYKDECDDSETDWADDSNGFKRSASARYRHRRSINRNSSNASRSNMSEGSRWSRSHKGRNSPTDYNDLSDQDGHDVIHESDVSDEELRNLSSSPASSRSKRVRRTHSIRKVEILNMLYIDFYFCVRPTITRDHFLKKYYLNYALTINRHNNDLRYVQ